MTKFLLVTSPRIYPWEQSKIQNPKSNDDLRYVAQVRTFIDFVGSALAPLFGQLGIEAVHWEHQRGLQIQQQA